MKILKKLTCLFFLLSAATWANSSVKTVKAEEVLFTVATKSGGHGYIFKSTNGGQSWQIVWDGSLESESLVAGKSGLRDIAYGNGKLIAVGKTVLVSSDMGKTWKETVITNPAGGNVFRGANRFFRAVAFADGMFLITGDRNQILYSSDAENWTYVGSKPNSISTKKNIEKPKKNGLGKITRKIKKKAFSMNNNSSSSNDGELPYGGYSNLNILDAPEDLIYLNGRFIAVGGNRKIELAYFKKEGNAIVLEKNVDLGQKGNLNSGGIQNITHNGSGTMVAVANADKSIFSTDGGETWKVRYQPDKQQQYAIAYANGQWVGISPFGDVYTSSDNQNWQKNRIQVRQINDLKYIGGKFIGVAHNATLLISSDAKNWKTSKISNESGMHLYSVIQIK